MADKSVMPEYGKVSNPWPEIENASNTGERRKLNKWLSREVSKRRGVKAGSYFKKARKGYERMLEEAGE